MTGAEIVKSAEQAAKNANECWFGAVFRGLDLDVFADFSGQARDAAIAAKAHAEAGDLVSADRSRRRARAINRAMWVAYNGSTSKIVVEGD